MGNEEYEAYSIKTKFIRVEESLKNTQNGVDTLLDNRVSTLKTVNFAYIFFSNKPVSLKKSNAKDSKDYSQSVCLDNETVNKCQLFFEFISGPRRLQHEEWIGIMLNIINKI